jgi:High potential iron-sulfur protein
VKDTVDKCRRQILAKVVFGVTLMPFAARLTSAAAEAPLVASDDPVAKALKYVSDAAKAPDAEPGSSCVNCKLYQGLTGGAQGGCLLFPGKSVKSSGWCSSWTAKS